MSRSFSGDPDAVRMTVRVADVVAAIRNLEPGFRSVETVSERYDAVRGDYGRIYTRNVSWFITSLGLERFRFYGERGWNIDPADLARRWPRLPWVGPDCPALERLGGCEADPSWLIYQCRLDRERVSRERAEASLAGPDQIDFSENPMG